MKSLLFCFSFVTITLFSLSSCKEKVDPVRVELDALKTEVIAVHDDVMPKITQIMMLGRNIRKNIDTYPDQERAKQVVAELKSAENGMMDWMQDFDGEKTFDSPDGERAYLDNEMVKIIKVRDDMLNSIKNAQTLNNEK